LADEKPSALESALGYTTISGNVESSVLVDDGMLAPSDISTSFSLSPIPEPSSIDLIAVGTVCFVIFSFAKWPAGHAFVTSK